eukprot:scaffold99341_cov15-Tisochrysis_lutea.AAC.1
MGSSSATRLGRFALGLLYASLLALCGWAAYDIRLYAIRNYGQRLPHGFLRAPRRSAGRNGEENRCLVSPLPLPLPLSALRREGARL